MSKRIQVSTALPASGFLRQSQLIPAILPVSVSTLWRMVKRGDFPVPHKISQRVTAWCKDDVQRWLDDKSGKSSF